MPVHLSNIGFSGTQIGFLLALGPLMILVSQPFWGTTGDRSRSVNRVFRWILGGSALTVAIIPLTQNYYILLVIACAYAFFNSPAFAIQDTLTLQAIEKTNIRYGTVRIGSTTGFAVTSIVAGLIAKWDLRALFPLAGLLALLSFLLTYRLPTITGHQTRENRVSPAVLLKNRELILLTAFCFLCMLSFGYYSSFFSIYFVELGGDSSQLGVFWFISALVEIPFLPLAERIIKRFGIHKTLLVRHCRVYSLVVVVFCAGRGRSHADRHLLRIFFIVFVYSMATYINRHVPPELKSTDKISKGFSG